MSEKHKCCANAWKGWLCGNQPCGKSALHEHDGKWYCKKHHPPSVRAKEEARRAKWNAEVAEILRKDHAAAEQKRRADAYEGLVALNANLVSVLKGALHCVHSEGHPFRHWHLAAANVLERAAQQTKEDSHE